MSPSTSPIAVVDTSAAPAARGRLLGPARLATLASLGADLNPITEQLIERCSDSDDAEALLDLSTVLLLQGHQSVGLAVQAQALQVRRLFRLAAGPSQTLRLLAIMAPGDLQANLPLPFLLQDDGVRLELLYLGSGEALPEPLPEHDRLVLAVAESALARELLRRFEPASAGPAEAGPAAAGQRQPGHRLASQGPAARRRQARRYRIVLIDGLPYAGHMAISAHWMVHYLNAGMSDSLQRREEEELFLRGFDQGFTARHGAALRWLGDRLGLDRLVVDCAEDSDGRLRVFGVEPCAVLQSADPEDLFPYRPEQLRKPYSSFRRRFDDRSH